MNRQSACCPQISLISVLRRLPDAAAVLAGSEVYPSVSGTMRLYQTNAGVIVYTQMQGLPASGEPCQTRVFGFHIHAGEICAGDMQDPFSGAMAHFNPENCPHPAHAGDLPPLFGCGSTALSLFLTDRFSAHEVIGRTVIVHDRPDDFTTQPSGNSGTRIACGEIRSARRA